MRPGVRSLILTALSPAPTLILPLSAPPSPLQYTWYPVTLAVGVQETLILVRLTCTALRLVGESAAGSEKRVWAIHINKSQKSFLNENKSM